MTFPAMTTYDSTHSLMGTWGACGGTYGEHGDRDVDLPHEKIGQEFPQSTHTHTYTWKINMRKLHKHPLNLVKTHTHTHTHIHTYIHTYTHTHMHIHTYIHTYTHTHAHTNMHAHTCTHMSHDMSHDMSGM